MDQITRTDLISIVEQSRFTPTPAQCRRRAELHQGAIQVSPDMSLEALLDAGVSGVVSRWWATPGFREWFLSKDHNKHQAEALLQQAMLRLGDVLRDSDDNSEIINAAKEARTLYTALNAPDKNGDEKFADADVQEMSKEELEQYIKKNTAGTTK